MHALPFAPERTLCTSILPVATFIFYSVSSFSGALAVVVVEEQKGTGMVRGPQ